MSSMAQKIDEDNQTLIKKNQELKIQYATQDNDTVLLKKQITYHKKQGLQLKQQYEELKARVEEQQRLEQHNEQMLHQNGSAPNINIKSAVRRQ